MAGTNPEILGRYRTEFKPDHAVYIDSPALSAINQILPFFNSGIFDRVKTRIYLHTRALVRAQLTVSRLPRDMDIRRTRGWHNGEFDLATDAVVFYPYNSASCMHTVGNRSARHVLTLHGESNKSASNTPSARIYDYVSIAGPLARDRYLAAGIFTRDDVDRGRLVMMGDSYVQSLSWIAPETSADTSTEPALFYAPTWEGYASGPDDHTSVTDAAGFAIAARAARKIGVRRIVIKPHPFLGLLRPAVLIDFVRGVRHLIDEGFEPELAISKTNRGVKAVCMAFLPLVRRLRDTDTTQVPVRLAISDVSGMEAVFLKQGIRHLVIAHEENIPDGVRDFYYRKAILDADDLDPLTEAYLAEAEEIDAIHRSRVFGWQEPALEHRDGLARREWLIDYVRRDPFWQTA